MNDDKAWLLFLFINVMGLLLVVIGLCLALQHASACADVLECLDAGATRDQCDTLFPECSDDD